MLPLAYYGDAVLKKKGEPVLKITEEIRKLADEMIDTMDACDGVGLAAPQVHHSVRMFVIRTLSNTEENSEMGEAKVLINPKIRQIGSETWEAEEGCLSIPGFRSIVKRAKEIEVEYTNLDGKVIKERASGWLARVILHENDHIDGVLFIDRLNLEEQKKLTPDLEKLKRRIHDHKTL
ncbi:MAG: peptide deformylase [Chlamydiae bacterium RIFCSPHIGHO2_12_FULL_49_9]|nr:MAG: peptide deformylase [Chlamydiae bacterium RIFCSPHIGHO2_12_FULL_49_9]